MRIAALLLVFLALGACSSTVTTEEEILAGTADTAMALGDVGEFLFWDVPVFVLWKVPKAVLYEFPRRVIYSFRNIRGKVADLVSSLKENDLSVEEEVGVTEELRTLTGLPIRSAERWIEWWHEQGEEPAHKWREEFVLDAIRRLRSDDYFTRATAIADLKLMYGTDLNYDPKALPSGREEGAARWETYFVREGLPPRD